MRSTDGQGLDWPIEYKDIAPYYDKAEIFMGVCGAKENHPDLPDGDNFLPPVAFKCSDVAIKKAAEKAGLRAIRVRRAMLTKITTDTAIAIIAADARTAARRNPSTTRRSARSRR